MWHLNLAKVVNENIWLIMIWILSIAHIHYSTYYLEFGDQEECDP